MNKIRDSFLHKYGVWEYILFIVGLMLIAKTTHSFIVADFHIMTWNEIGMIILVFLLGTLAMAAPKAILDAARSKFKKDAR